MDEGVLLAYRAAKLEEKESEVVEAHLAGCSTCQGLLASLAAEIPRAPEAPARSPLFWVGLAAAACAVAAAAYFYVDRDPQPKAADLFAHRAVFSGDARTMSPEPRAGSDAPLVLSEGSTLKIELLPEGDAPAPEVGIFVLDRGKLRGLEGVEVERIADGLKIAVRVDELKKHAPLTVLLAAAADRGVLSRLDGAEWERIKTSADVRFWMRDVQILPLAQP